MRKFFVKILALCLFISIGSFSSCTSTGGKVSLLDSLSTTDRATADSLLLFYDGYVRSMMGDSESQIGAVYVAFMDKYARSFVESGDLGPFVPSHDAQIASIIYSAMDTLNRRISYNPNTSKIMLSVMEQFIRSGAMPEMADWHSSFEALGWFGPSSYADLFYSYKKMNFDYDGLRLLMACMMVERLADARPKM